MDQKNIELLAARLIQLGCKPMVTTQMAAHACFGLLQFDLTHIEEYGEDCCYVVIHCRKGNHVGYDALYYTAILKRRPSVPDGLEVLDRQMAAVDWRQIIATRIDGVGCSVDDFVSVATLVDQLSEVDIHGILRYRYWSGTSLETLVPELAHLKSQYEIQQRFYLTPDQAPIRFEEAYRFLQSRWMEKRFQTERKLLLKKERRSDGGDASKKLLVKRKPLHRT